MRLTLAGPADAEMRAARRRTQERLRAGVRAGFTCPSCGAEVSSLINGRCRSCAEGTSWMSSAARADLNRMDLREQRRRIDDAVERLSVLDALESLAHAEDEDVRRVADADVPADTRHVAMCAVVLAAEEVGIDAPSVAWFGGSREVAGYAPQGRGLVLLNADLRGERLVEVAAHEVAHVAGQQHPHADEFGRRFAAAYYGRLRDAA